MEYEDGLHAPPSAAARSYRAPGGAAAWILCGGGDADLKLADCAAALLELSPEKDGVPLPSGDLARWSWFCSLKRTA